MGSQGANPYPQSNTPDTTQQIIDLIHHYEQGSSQDEQGSSQDSDLQAISNLLHTIPNPSRELKIAINRLNMEIANLHKARDLETSGTADFDNLSYESQQLHAQLQRDPDNATLQSQISQVDIQMGYAKQRMQAGSMGVVLDSNQVYQDLIAIKGVLLGG